ncbi:hypothetical protein BC938DRAFT_478697 [Jimgerdemannia flammicorona]|uniref:Uncharacterized protein n=1 Tax=Jimgerdemannia flammicorona TaxID=994334 RepID=A0A433QMG9_9FUNG|nr:hypothetical protein BC938DRAFT_478697 [Jimgerdemannia flammicorona]
MNLNPLLLFQPRALACRSCSPYLNLGLIPVIRHQPYRFPSYPSAKNSPPPDHEYDYIYGHSSVLLALRQARRKPLGLLVQRSIMEDTPKKKIKAIIQAIHKEATRAKIFPVYTDKGDLNNLSNNRPHQVPSSLDYDILLFIYVSCCAQSPPFSTQGYGSYMASNDSEQVCRFKWPSGRSPVWLALDEVQDPQVGWVHTKVDLKPIYVHSFCYPNDNPVFADIHPIHHTELLLTQSCSGIKNERRGYGSHGHLLGFEPAEILDGGLRNCLLFWGSRPMLESLTNDSRYQHISHITGNAIPRLEDHRRRHRRFHQHPGSPRLNRHTGPPAAPAPPSTAGLAARPVHCVTTSRQAACPCAGQRGNRAENKRENIVRPHRVLVSWIVGRVINDDYELRLSGEQWSCSMDIGNEQREAYGIIAPIIIQKSNLPAPLFFLRLVAQHMRHKQPVGLFGNIDRGHVARECMDMVIPRVLDMGNQTFPHVCMRVRD